MNAGRAPAVTRGQAPAHPRGGAPDVAGLLERLAAGGLTEDDHAAVGRVIDRLIAGPRAADALAAARLLEGFRRRIAALAASLDPYRDWMTREEAARALRRSVRTLCDWAWRGHGPRHEIRDGRAMYRRADVEAHARGELRTVSAPGRRSPGKGRAAA